MEVSIIGMWCISSVSINSCDIVKISSNAVSTLHQSLWLVGTSWIWLELPTSRLSVQAIKRELHGLVCTSHLDVDKGGCVIQI